MYKIEDSVPIPNKNGPQVDTFLYMLRSMKVGQSVVVPIAKARSAYSQASNAKIKIKVRAISSSQARIWRVA